MYLRSKDVLTIKRCINYYKRMYLRSKDVFTIIKGDTKTKITLYDLSSHFYHDELYKSHLEPT